MVSRYVKTRECRMGPESSDFGKIKMEILVLIYLVELLVLVTLVSRIFGTKKFYYGSYNKTW